MGFISDLILNVSAFRIKIGEKLNTLFSWIGNLPSLNTNHKTDIVGAINEVNGKSFTQAKQLRTYYLKTASYNTVRKLRLYFNESFAGTLKIEVTGSFNAGNTNGEIVVQGGLGVNVGSFLWNEAISCTHSRGAIRNWIYINPTVLFDSANGRAYIEINKKIAGDNDYTLKITLLSIHTDLTTMDPYLVDTGTANVENETNNVFFEGKITVSGGNSDQWDLAFARGDFRDYGLGIITAPFVTNDTNGLPNGFYRAQVGAIMAAIGGAYSSVYHSDWGGGYSQDLIIGDNGRIAVGFSSPGNPTYQIKEIFTGNNFNPNNYIPISHPAYNVTQANINNWLTYLGYWDIRQIRPGDIDVLRLQFGFGSWNNNNAGEWADYLHFGGYGDPSGGAQNLIMFKKNGFGLRQFQGTSQSPSVYQSFVDYFHTGNFDPNTKADISYVDAKVAAIPTHNGQLTVNTTADLVGGYVYLPSGNLTTTLGLATHVLNAIADGQVAYSWGDHTKQGYQNATQVTAIVNSAVAGIPAPGNGTVVLQGIGSLAGTATFSMNQTNNVVGSFDLTPQTKAQIQKGSDGANKLEEFFGNIKKYYQYHNVSGGGTGALSEAFFNVLNPTNVSGLIIHVDDHEVDGARLVIQGVSGAGVNEFHGRFINKMEGYFQVLFLEGIDKEYVWDAEAARWREVF